MICEQTIGDCRMILKDAGLFMEIMDTPRPAPKPTVTADMFAAPEE